MLKVDDNLTSVNFIQPCLLTAVRSPSITLPLIWNKVRELVLQIHARGGGVAPVVHLATPASHKLCTSLDYLFFLQTCLFHPQGCHDQEIHRSIHSPWTPGDCSQLSTWPVVIWHHLMFTVHRLAVSHHGIKVPGCSLAGVVALEVKLGKYWVGHPCRLVTET